MHPPRLARLLTLLLAISALGALVFLLQRPLVFDDSYMFYRYALRLRAGDGFAWNPHGEPTFGMTSLPWGVVMVPFTFLPLDPGHALRLASGLTGLLALGLMARTLALHSTRKWLPMLVILLAGVLFNQRFVSNAATGMDTMLSLLANALVVHAVLRFVQIPQQKHAIQLGLAIGLSFLVRPENALPAGLCALLAWLWLLPERRPRHLLLLAGIPALILLLFLLATTHYFGYPLPLGFYAKSAHLYQGYTAANRWPPFQFLHDFALVGLPFLLAALLLSLPEDRRFLLVFLLPVLAVSLYLLTVTQIMGSNGRYSMPFLPYVVVPSLLLVLKRLQKPQFSPQISLQGALLALTLLLLASAGLEERLDLLRSQFVDTTPVPVPHLPTLSGRELPQDDDPALLQTMGDSLFRHLPAGTRMAASEVGYIGAMRPDLPLIDLVGLNDNHIGVHGFSMDYLLAQKPDFIWLPHPSYTGIRAQMLGDPRLLEQYAVVPGAFLYGIAMRKDTPLRQGIEAAVDVAWKQTYGALDRQQFTALGR